jgi:hypothetical protein
VIELSGDFDRREKSRKEKQIHLGSRVRITDGAVLHAALRWPVDLRPAPGQMLWADRTTSVTGYRRSPEGRSLYVLKGAPGLWPEGWIDPLRSGCR